MRFTPLLLLSITLCFSNGCSEKNWSFVEGNVTVDGQPFGPGTISFKPADLGARGGGIGEIGADGHYVVKSSGKKEGLAAGEYLVAISDNSIGDAEDLTPKNTKSNLPKKYTRTSTSGLVRTVEQGAQTLDFDLEI